MRDVQTWRMEVALVILKRTGAQTASELAERFGALCMADGHPAALWRDVDPSTMHGILRKAERAGQVTRVGEQHDARAGRQSPKFAVAAPESVPDKYPPVPSEEAVAARTPRPEPSQDEVLLGAFDELAGILARHHRELDSFTERLAVRLGIAHG